MAGLGTALNPFIGLPSGGVFDIVTNIETGVTMNMDRSTGIYYASEESLQNPIYPVKTALDMAVNQGIGTVAGFIDSAGSAITVKTSELAAALSASMNQTTQSKVGDPLQESNKQVAQSILENPSQLVQNPVSSISSSMSGVKIEQYLTLGILFLIISTITGIFRRE